MQLSQISFHGVLLGLILVSAWGVLFLLYQIIKQQGRLLLRLDGIEQHLGLRAPAGGAPAMPAGLAVGTPFAPFKLPDLTGKEVALEDFRGKKTFLVNWSPGCGFCDLIAPDLAKLQADLRKRNVQLVLAAYGDGEANRKLAEEHGLECPILVQKDSQSLEAFQNLGTPVAYLLDEQGQVAQPIAVGAEHVPALAREAANGQPKRKHLPGERPLSESRVEREGIKAGTPAPSFRLPDIYGRTVSLEEYRDRRVLLVFSDPHCGPCDQLAPHLVQLHQQHRANNLAVVMVGRGDPEENRRKAKEHGFEFPVVLQERWKLSKEYGIFATPVAFLIDEKGVIARNVSQGTDEILALAREGLAAEKV
jgi:peroxiredoxin